MLAEPATGKLVPIDLPSLVPAALDKKNEAKEEVVQSVASDPPR